MNVKIGDIIEVGIYNNQYKVLNVMKNKIFVTPFKVMNSRTIMTSPGWYQKRYINNIIRNYNHPITDLFK